MTNKPQPSFKTRQATLFHLALACAAIATPASALAAPQAGGSSQQGAAPQSAPAKAADGGTAVAPAKTGPATTQKPDRSAAYYHFGLAHMYEEMATNYGRPEYATRAIEEYKLALDADPNSKYLNRGL